ncbi:MAG: DUF4167 domain-containing protein [Pseudomonadota bacterium]
MRPAQKQNRVRSRGNRKGGNGGGNNLNRVYESAGPEGKVRGTPQQIVDKYLSLARDAQTSGDRVTAENFLQHAEHYQRILTAALGAQADRRDPAGEDDDDERQPAPAEARANGNGNGAAAGLNGSSQGHDDDAPADEAERDGQDGSRRRRRSRRGEDRDGEGAQARRSGGSHGSGESEATAATDDPSGAEGAAERPAEDAAHRGSGEPAGDGDPRDGDPRDGARQAPGGAVIDSFATIEPEDGAPGPDIVVDQQVETPPRRRRPARRAKAEDDAPAVTPGEDG